MRRLCCSQAGRADLTGRAFAFTHFPLEAAMRRKPNCPLLPGSGSSGKMCSCGDWGLSGLGSTGSVGLPASPFPTSREESPSLWEWLWSSVPPFFSFFICYTKEALRWRWVVQSSPAAYSSEQEACSISVAKTERSKVANSCRKGRAAPGRRPLSPRSLVEICWEVAKERCPRGLARKL